MFPRGDFFITDEFAAVCGLSIREGPGFLFGCPVTVARDEQRCQWNFYIDAEHPHHEHYEFRRGGWEAPPFPGPTRSHLQQAQDRADTFLQRSNDVLEEHDAWNPADDLRETWIQNPEYQPWAETPEEGEEWPFKSF